MKSRKTATVMQNSFVVLNKHNYSVPKEYIGKRVDLIYDADNIILHPSYRAAITFQSTICQRAER